MAKAWFKASMECSPSGKGIIVPMEYTPIVYNPYGKGMVLWKILLQMANDHGKR